VPLALRSVIVRYRMYLFHVRVRRIAHGTTNGGFDVTLKRHMNPLSLNREAILWYVIDANVYHFLGTLKFPFR
jgi:hypothetical protein